METQDDICKLASLIKDIPIAMMTTTDAAGMLHSRPMATQHVDFDGELWFFTSSQSHKVEELRRNNRVNISYQAIDHQRYVSVSGTASVVVNRSKFRQLWSPAYRAWFPKGIDDPELILLRIDVEQAEYWDTPSLAVVRLVGFLKAVTTGTRYEGGEHGTLRP